jgi:hypothetical protein
MSLTAEQAEAIKNELKRFAGDLNLSDEQKTKLHERLPIFRSFYPKRGIRKFLATDFEEVM